jgi:hypothetical protein
MMAFVFYTVALLLVGLSRIIGGRLYLGFFAGGFLFGLYNEICFEFCWDYSPQLGFMIWRDVPLIVVLGWGITCLFAFTCSQRIMTRLLPSNRLALHLGDLVFFTLYGVANENIMWHFNYWKYAATLHSNLLIHIFGYASIALLTSLSGRALQAMLDKKH